VYNQSYKKSFFAFGGFSYMTDYTHGYHTIYHHRYHLVWITKYRYKVLTGVLRERVREIIAQVATEMDIKIVNGVLSTDHVHIFAEIPPHIAVSEFVKIAKGRSSRKIQMEFAHIKQRYWGRHFWGRGYFSTTSGNVTDDMIHAYIDKHSDAHYSDNARNIAIE
jgi:putative transposase